MSFDADAPIKELEAVSPFKLAACEVIDVRGNAFLAAKGG
jgi:hypothetical protein